MAELDFQRAAVLLFDPVHVNIRTTRYALNEIGFKSIEACSTIEDFQRQLKENSWDLIVAECSNPKIDIFRLVRMIRRGEATPNPYSVIALTSWTRKGGHVRQAIESGADDVIVRPFSTQFAEDRIRTMVRDRKSFVVTSDYVGPDRRSGDRAALDKDCVAVPNTLSAKAVGDEEQLREAYSAISDAKKTIEAERIRRLAMRIVVSAELQFDAKAGPPKAFDPADMMKSARELRDQLESVGQFQAVQVGEALLDHVRNFRNPDERTTKNFRLAKEMAIGVYAAYADGRSIEKDKDEISKTVSALRKRMSSERPGSSVQDLPELKAASM
ncbi:response regulator [Hyphobacterium sp. HN65]|uniref:Response regulator n=1 Tax=Hyphobacterium lacteum TaxID=3116575 RepID=A0ABU7LLY8_9PROT|nr:response regulator [Hyphobacterium sp. HN65]MEE2524914.1 response regulator [Hyphobacterium sp. HN65]